MNFFFVLLCAALLDIFAARWRVPFVKGACKKCMDVLVGVFRKIPLQSLRSQKIGGIVFVCVICLLTFASVWVLLFYMAKLHVIISFAIEVFCAFHLIDVRSFSRYILKNRGNYSANDLIITTVIHFTNYCIAPLLYILLGGIPLAIMCRAINYCAKKLCASGQDVQGKVALVRFDEGLHFLPSYVLVLAVLSSSAVLPFCNPGHGWDMFVRDRKKFTPQWKSRIISICAGILGIQLTFLHNAVAEKSLIGDPLYSLTSEHAKMTVYLMYAGASFVFAFCLIFSIAFLAMIL